MLVSLTRYLRPLLAITLCILSQLLAGQQVGDTAYHPPIISPAYPSKAGPLVFIDAGHHNFHTMEGRYHAFAQLLRRDGYQVRSYESAFTRKGLDESDILVISNALHEENESAWHLPVHSAFTDNEIEVVRAWVEDGGGLFLIADHMPMAGAAADLAGVFGITFTNGFVFDSTTQGPIVFSREDGTLVESPLTNGRSQAEKVDRVVTFTGQGFQIPDHATSVLLLNDHCTNFLPDTAWVFTDSTHRQSAAGWSQGAFLEYGQGKVYVSGEAAMFTAQLAGPQQRKFGMNSELASENYKLLLNIVHWLDDNDLSK